MRYRSLRKRLIDTLRTAINRYDGNLPEPKPLTVVAECSDQTGSDGKPMERLTDNLKYVEGPLPGQTTLTGQKWSKHLHGGSRRRPPPVRPERREPRDRPGGLPSVEHETA